MLNNSAPIISLLLLLLTVAIVMDIYFKRIPNWLTLTMLIAGLSSQIMLSGVAGLATSLGGIAVGFGCLFPFYLKGGMGAGDVKLLAAIGSFLSFKLTLLAAGYTLISGGLMALAVMLVRGNVKALMMRYVGMVKVFAGTRKLIYFPPGEDEPGQLRFAYALAIATGTCVVLYQNNLMAFIG